MSGEFPVVHTPAAIRRRGLRLWVPNIRPRLLGLRFSRGTRAGVVVGVNHALRARRARGTLGTGSASCVDERSVPEAMGFREAEAVPARPWLPFVVLPAQLVVTSRVDAVPC